MTWMPAHTRHPENITELKQLYQTEWSKFLQYIVQAWSAATKGPCLRLLVPKEVHKIHFHCADYTDDVGLHNIQNNYRCSFCTLLTFTFHITLFNFTLFISCIYKCALQKHVHKGIWFTIWAPSEEHSTVVLVLGSVVGPFTVDSYLPLLPPLCSGLLLCKIMLHLLPTLPWNITLSWSYWSMQNAIVRLAMLKYNFAFFTSLFLWRLVKYKATGSRVSMHMNYFYQCI